MATQKEVCFLANFARIRRLYNKDEEVVQQGWGGYTTKIRRLYNKDEEVMFSDAIIEPLQKCFAYKGCKKLVFFICKFCLTSRICLVSVLLSASVERCFVSHMRDFEKNIFFKSIHIFRFTKSVFGQHFYFPNNFF